MIITGIELLGRLGDLGFTNVKCFRDARYFLPSREWLGNAFAPFLAHKFWKYKRAYIKSRFDCDKFAHEARLEAKIDGFLMANAAEFALEAAALCLKESTDIGDAGMAFLYVEMEILPGRSLNNVGPGLHAADLCVHPDGGTLMEPQNSLLTDALAALDPVQPHENPDRHSARVCTPAWAWV